MPDTQVEASAPDAPALLAAEFQIGRQLHNYCRAVDRLDLELLTAVWHPDGTLDFEDPEILGPVAAYAGELLDWYRGWAAHSIQITNRLIEVNGQHAVSEVYALDVMRAHPDASDRVRDHHVRSRYLDHWSRRDGHWAIDHRQALLTFHWHQIVEEGRIGERSHRDRQDPVYDLWATTAGRMLDA